MISKTDFHPKDDWGEREGKKKNHKALFMLILMPYETLKLVCLAGYAGILKTETDFFNRSVPKTQYHMTVMRLSVKHFLVIFPA